jgi:hypothetical protein
VVLLIVVLLAGGIFSIPLFFSSATVVISPKEMNLPVNVTGSASLGSTNGALKYEIATLSREGTKEIPASGEEEVRRSATGKIVIYNDYSAEPQTLVARTRFETPGGLIFRIQEQITVPGQKTVSGVKTPGSVTATVIADAPGEEYNVGLADFTIPGFEGDPRFSKFSAKSDPQNPITGGFVGVIKKVSESDQTASKIAIEAELKKELSEQLTSQIPNTHILFRNGATFSFEELPQEPGSSNSTAIIKERGTIHGILFNRKDLSEFIANNYEQIKGKKVNIENLDSISFTLNEVNLFNPETSEEISFKIVGDAKFVWEIPTDEVKNSLIGQKRSNIKDILSKFEAVERANLSFMPPWTLSIPKDPSKIKLEIEASE